MTSSRRFESSPRRSTNPQHYSRPIRLRFLSLHLLGRILADALLGHWLTAEAEDPDLSSGEVANARWATAAHKQRPGKNIVVHGGVRTVHNLARLNLIDEHQLVVHPLALGDGGKLVRNLPGRLKLNLMAVAEPGVGQALLRYRPVAPFHNATVAES
jgi:hypothetical protein